MEFQFERKALFKKVWETPIRTLAAKHRLSDNGLRDICHTLTIPVPPRERWAKKAAGHQVSLPVLPPLIGPESYTFRSKQREFLHSPNKEFAAWLSEKLAFDADQANMIVVAPALIRLHPFVRQTVQALAEYQCGPNVLHMHPTGVGVRSEERHDQVQANISVHGLSYFNFPRG